MLLIGTRRLYNSSGSQTSEDNAVCRTIETAVTYLPKSSNARGIVTRAGRFDGGLSRFPKIPQCAPETSRTTESAETRINGENIVDPAGEGRGQRTAPRAGTKLNTELTGAVGVTLARPPWTRFLMSADVPCAITRGGLGTAP